MNIDTRPDNLCHPSVISLKGFNYSTYCV